MRPEQARLRRLERLERVRSIARQEAAREAAQAEGTLAQLSALADRTAALAEHYRQRTDPADALGLAQQHAVLAGLTGISTTTRGDAAQARALADRKQEELALAERRRAAVEDRAEAERRRLAQRRVGPALGARRTGPIGTGLE
jgi:hypothetical protein